eukprot:CAMPEP_0180783952 /NCGR_PEP_ID=MMETSP1038_2-20121128/49321_1 /TAXON_ID=632150 /ORGANISM="Azadinium spinosum, Strain 3D9" /LENGTH=99 /DNA_ID=CAMNT_0022820601 /DNA_START=173 /DNA_END=473 /DNA_ORIENTATION=+
MTVLEENLAPVLPRLLDLLPRREGRVQGHVALPLEKVVLGGVQILGEVSEDVAIPLAHAAQGMELGASTRSNAVSAASVTLDHWRTAVCALLGMSYHGQ